MKILIKNGRVIDPANGLDAVRDVLVDDGVIADVAPAINCKADEALDAAGLIVAPGFVDMHVHLREPGREDKETVASGTAAAVRGGVTTVLAMPNTEPAMDAVPQILRLREVIAQDARAHVYIAGAITRGRMGKELTDFMALREAGVLAFTDDGTSVNDESLMREALIRAQEARAAVLAHCEDPALSAGGVVNYGFTSTRLGLRGISNASEFERVRRDIALAEALRVPVHIQHVSCRESVDIIAAAKKRGARVTAETAPHYFTLTEAAVLEYDTNMKMNPPLRSADDVRAVIDGLRAGVIDVIASDHAPHTENEKDIEFDRAAFGVTGLETEMAAAATGLVNPGIIGWPRLVEALSLNPARILGIPKGTLSKGADGDIAVIDPRREWTVERQGFASKSKNSCFLGKRLCADVVFTLVRGMVRYRADR